VREPACIGISVKKAYKSSFTEDFIMNQGSKIVTGIAIVVIVLIVVWLIEKPAQQADCSELDEEQCRNQSSCIPLGTSIKLFLETGGELEAFVFEE
jgi:hypothetical protein